VAGEAVLDVGEHVAIGDRQRREVHRDAAVVAVVVGEPLGDLVEHAAVDLADQPVALGRGQEAGRPDHATVILVEQPHERLVVGDPPVGQRDDRLVVQDEQVVRERSTQAPEHRAALHPGGRADPLAAGLGHLHAAEALLRRAHGRSHQQARRCLGDRRCAHLGAGLRRAARVPCGARGDGRGRPCETQSAGLGERPPRVRTRLRAQRAPPPA
jgi:hypothetical protein